MPGIVSRWESMTLAGLNEALWANSRRKNREIYHNVSRYIYE